MLELILNSLDLSFKRADGLKREVDALKKKVKGTTSHVSRSTCVCLVSDTYLHSSYETGCFLSLFFRPRVVISQVLKRTIYSSKMR